ncbi:MAG TPA: BREX-2 system phosphatase PglZ, partial [Polyangiaceae bacterium]|nr:BREX-2 system phosphatase PglZ [Polyangiaceae bacterium]
MNPLTLLRRLIELAGGPAEQGYVLALANDTLRDVPPSFSTGAASYTVVRPSSEIRLRHILWQAKGAPLLALVDEPLARRLPADLVHAARGAKIHAVETAEILSLALRTQVQAGDDEELQRLALDHVDRLTGMLEQRTLPTVVDRALLDELLADVLLGHEARKLTAADLLVEWLRGPREWSRTERALLERQLPKLFALEGRVLAWTLAEPKRAELVIVHGALLALDEPELPQKTWGDLWGVESQTVLGMTRETFRHTVRMLARGALDRLGADALRLLEKTDSIARRTLTPSVHRRSQDLPLGLENRCEAIAQRIEAGEVVAHDELQDMRRHRFAKAREREIDVLQEAARLTRYLASSADDGAGVVARVRHYQRHGAFADLAAARLRAALAANVAYGKAARAVLERYRQRRNEENSGFAETLRESYSAALHAEGCVPLHRMWTRGPVRNKSGRYDLFLVVLDGCSYPVFLRLLRELASDTRAIGLRADASGEAHGSVALAPLPTITSHARGAIFLGELPRDPYLAESVWRDEKEAVTDPARLRQNPTLGSRTRKLFLKGQLGDHGEALVGALRDGSIEIVAAVFNAVDDQIGSSNTGAHVAVSARSIAGFVPSLFAGLDAGRRVVLTADHGHTPFWGNEHRVGSGSTPRFRILGDGEPVPDGFIELGG